MSFLCVVQSTPSAPADDLSKLLASLNLTGYLTKLHETGAESVEDAKLFSVEELQTDVGMKVLQARKLYQALHQTPALAPTPTLPALPVASNQTAPSLEWVQKAKNPQNLFNAARQGDVYVFTFACQNSSKLILT